MKIQKRCVLKIALWTLICLAFCTILAGRIDELLITEVTCVKTTPGNIDGTFFSVTAPVSCIYPDPEYGDCVFLIQEKQGLHRKEYYVKKMPVTILAENNYSVALDSQSPDALELAAYSSRSLENMEQVRVVEK